MRTQYYDMLSRIPGMDALANITDRLRTWADQDAEQLSEAQAADIVTVCDCLDAALEREDYKEQEIQQQQERLASIARLASPLITD